MGNYLYTELDSCGIYFPKLDFPSEHFMRETLRPSVLVLGSCFFVNCIFGRVLGIVILCKG